MLNIDSVLDVALDSCKSMKNNSKKTVVYGGLAGLIYGSCINNPDKNSFMNQLHSTELSIAMVPVSSQNPKATEYIRFLNRNLNQCTLRITSLGFCSIMWISDYSSNEATAQATCDYLDPELSTFFTNRVIDIGWWDHWWNLQKQTEDYDVNY